MKEYYECNICEKVIEKKEVTILNNKNYYCKKHWKGYLELSKILEKKGGTK